MRSAAVRSVVVAGLGLLSLAGATAVHAQSSGDSSGFTDLVPVAVWTLVVVAIALAVVSVGYLYRRARGLDEPRPEVPIPPLLETEPPSYLDAAGQPLPEHVVHEHAAARHDDATEQAELLHESRR